jgi:hypothetical protein
MSRTLILTLAAAATITVASLASSASYARGFSGGGHASVGGHVSIGGHANFGGRGRVAGNGGRLTPILNPGHPGHGYPGRPGRWAFHGHGHWIFRGGRWIVVDPVVGDAPDVAPVEAAASPAPCTCLTKTYTPDGLVMFADVCTKEAASAQKN